MLFAMRWALVFGSALPWAFANGAAQTDKELMSTWLRLESQKGHLQQSWLERKTSMEDKLRLFEVERESLTTFVNATTHEQSEVDAERQALLSRQSQLEREDDALAQAVAGALNQMTVLSNQLPPPIAIQWQQKLQSIGATDVSTSERLEGLLNLLKLSDEFNNRIAIHHGPIVLPGQDGSEQHRVVTQIYMGLSQGWFVSEDGSFLGYGRASDTGWTWWVDADASQMLGTPLKAEAILEVIHILKNPTAAKWVTLPVLIQ